MPYVSDLSRAEAVKRIKRYMASPSGFVLWLGECVLIPGPGGEVMPFALWPEQVRAAKEIAGHEKVIILKARQLGMTWLCLAHWLFEALYNPIKEYRVVSINEQKSADHLGRVRWMWENLPGWTKPEVEKLNTSTIQFRDSGSLIRSLPSTASAGRGDTLDGMLMDEDAFQALSRGIVLSALPALEKRKGKLIRLSTANGYGNDFEQAWQRAQRGEGGYHPVFLGWRADPARTDGWREAVKAEEGEDYVHQEYPETAEEAFLASGRPFFLLDRVVQMQGEAARLKPESGRLEGVPPHRVEFVEEYRGPLLVWRRPEVGKRYVLYCDPAEGLETGDWTVVYVMEAGGGVEVARWRGKADVAETTDVVDMLGSWYAYRTGSVYTPEDLPALAAVEANNIGAGVAIGLRERGYRNLWFNRDLVTGKIDDQRPGQMATRTSRRIILGVFQKRVRKGETRVVDPDCLGEMMQFYHRGSGGKPMAPDGGHDDCVMARAGADFLASLESEGAGVRAGEKLVDTDLGRDLGVVPAGMDYWFRKDQERLVSAGGRGWSRAEEV